MQNAGLKHILFVIILNMMHIYLHISDINMFFDCCSCRSEENRFASQKQFRSNLPDEGKSEECAK